MCRAANALRSGHFDWLPPALTGNDRQCGKLPPAISRIAESWPALPPHIREAILTLVDAGRASKNPTYYEQGDLESLARRLGRKCREVG
jgi:hypothetical protein